MYLIRNITVSHLLLLIGYPEVSYQLANPLIYQK